MKLVGVAFLSLCVLLSSVPLSARGPSVLDWARVRAIKVERGLIITTTGAPAGPAFFISADDESMTVRGAIDGQVHTLRRADVTRVESAPMKGGKIVGTALGGLVGGAIGWVGGIAVLLDDEQCAPSGCGGKVIKGYALIIGLPILGGVLGHVIASSSRRRVIYIKP